MTDPAPAKPPRQVKLITAACLFALFGIGLTLVHLFANLPLTFALFMIVGQGALGLAMVLYIIVVFMDPRVRKVL